MSVEHLGSTIRAVCTGPDCFADFPHAHQHFIYWPDDDIAQPSDTPTG